MPPFLPTTGELYEGRVVLVADDDRDARLLLMDILQGLDPGLILVEARHGAQALERVVARTPDLIILDLNMPVMDGMTALERLRAMESMQTVPILVLTSYDHEEIGADAIDLGADSFHAKPISAISLKSVVKSLLRIRWRFRNLAGG